jgi:outer membrane receptor for ferrienterochelin and colicins
VVAESFKAPSYMDLYFPGYNNPNLDPEKSVSYDFGFKYMDDICQREISFFRRDIDQLIKYNFVKSKPENINSATIKGIEFNTERQMNDNLDLGFNYTYLDANNDESQEQIGDMPYHKFGLNMKYIMNDTKYILNNRFTGERTDGSSNEDMDSYFISDFKIIKTVNDDTELKASINNLFDKDYEVVDGYPMPGRNYMLSISTKF